MKEMKAGVVAVFGVINGCLGTLAPVVYLLLSLQIADYATGIAAAPYRGEVRSSDRGLRGIGKKVSMLLLVALGGSLDWLLLYASRTIGLSAPFKCLFAALVAVWLVANEMISILENVGDIGVELPPFLMPLIRWIKAGTEAAAGSEHLEEQAPQQAILSGLQPKGEKP